MQRRIKCTDEEIIKASQNSKSAAEAARMLGIKYDTYKKYAEMLGVFKTNQSGKGISREYVFIEDESINYNYFNTIDSKLKAYLIGYIAADGGVRNNSVNFMIQRKDKEVLSKICEELNVNKNKIIDFESYRPGENKKFPSCRLFITSKQIVTDLNKYNIIPNKTNIDVDMFTCIPDEYKDSWLSGYIDGNGSFEKRTSGQVGIVSNHATIQSIAKYVESKYCIISHQYMSYKNGVTTKLNYGNAKTYKAILSDYLNASPYHLQRKLETVNYIIEAIEIKDRKISASEKAQNNLKEIRCNFCVDCGKMISASSTRCKSCRSKQPQYRKVQRPSRDTLKKEIRMKSFLQIGKEYCVTDNAVRKWCKAYGLPYKKNEIKKYSNSEWEKI